MLSPGHNVRWLLCLRANCLMFFLMAFLLHMVTATQYAMPERRRLELKAMSKEMFFHGWDNYLKFGYPADELNPILCKGRGSDKLNPSNININDILGDYSLTLIDTLDTLAIIGEQADFEDAVNRVLTDVSFNQDNRVQVFEVNIRVLGGLLSAHILASDPAYGHAIEGYSNGLLKMAQDLADRLIPAFQYTKTGIPYPRVNLRHGVARTETVETCTAGAGSLLLEFGVLSRLTNNTHYEDIAKRALKALWERRSDIDLLGNVINIQTGQWIHTASSTGAGIDSIFEYLLKAYVLFGEDEYLEMFENAYEGIMRHVRDPSGYLYRNVHMSSGALMATWIDSLSAFWPGVQVLYGDLDSAIKGHLVFYNIWRRYHALPERFDVFRKTVDIGFYPLRPEFIESTYHLYRATRDPFYLHVGEMVIEDLNNRTRLPCGFATIGDVRTGRLEDRMESFMLSESLKYLYLLFDVDNKFNKFDSNFVYTTEGHFLPMHSRFLKNNTAKQAPTPEYTCRPYNPSTAISNYNYSPHDLDMSSVPYLPESDFAAAIVDNTEEPIPDLHPNAYCVSPMSVAQSFELTFNTDTRAKFGRQSPKFVEIVGGFLTKSLSGLKFELTKRPQRTGGGYQVTRVHPNVRLKENQVLLVTMEALEPYLQHESLELEGSLQQALDSTVTQEAMVEVRLHGNNSSRVYSGAESAFGPRWQDLTDQAIVYFLDDERLLGCARYEQTDWERIGGKVVVVSRGGCTFFRKTVWAQEAGASAVIFVNNDSGTFRAMPADVEPDMPDAQPSIPSITVSLDDGIDLINFCSGEESAVADLVKPTWAQYPLASQPVRIKLHGQTVHNVIVLRR